MENIITIDENVTEKKTEKIEHDMNLEHLSPKSLLEEININLAEMPNEEITLKNRNTVYYEMYKEAMKKAKIAKDLALSSFLEAKRIKNLYMLDELNDEEYYEDENETDFEKI